MNASTADYIKLGITVRYGLQRWWRHLQIWKGGAEGHLQMWWVIPLKAHTHTWPTATQTTHTHTFCVCLKSAVFAHTSADKARCLHARLASLFVLQTNHPSVHTKHRGKGVAAEIFIDGLPMREGEEATEQMRDGWEENARSKEKSDPLMHTDMSGYG